MAPNFFKETCRYSKWCTSDQKCNPARCHINFELQDAGNDYDSMFARLKSK